MSNKTFDMSSDQSVHVDPLPHRDLQLGISSKSHYSNSSLSLSSDSSSSISNLSDREASSPDVNIQKSCLRDVGNPSTTLSRGNVLFSVRTKLNQTFTVTPVKDSLNICNENHETGSDNYQTFIKNTKDGCNNAFMSPNSAARASQLGSCDPSHRGSTENDCYSLSSGEMVLRSKGFCLEDESLLVVSSLEESSISLPAGCSATPAESNLLSNTVPDVCGKPPERLNKENSSNPCLGMTFTQTELPNVENDEVTSNCLVALPSESKGGPLMTCVCETPPADDGKGDRFASTEAQLLHFPAALTPEQGKAFVHALSAVQDTDKDINTSTPIQNTGNKIFCPPSFSESPFTGNAGTPGLHPVNRQQISGTSNRLAAGLLFSISKVKKMEIKKFPKSHFSSVTSKVMTRNVDPMSVSGPASQHKPLHVSMNKHSDAHRGESIRICPANVRSSPAVVSTTTKMALSAQRRVNTGVASGHPAVDGQAMSGESQPYDHPAANKHASAVQGGNASSETNHAASSQQLGAATQHAGNQAFSLSSSEKSPDRSGRTNPKPTPKRGMSNKIGTRSGSAIGQDKPPVLKTRPRCSSESSSLSSRPPKEKKPTRSFSSSFAIPRADTHPSQTRLGNPNCSSKNKDAVQAEAKNGSNENSTREVKKIGPVTVFSKSKLAGGSWDECKSRFRGRPSRQTGGTPLSQTPAASPRPAGLSARQRQASLGRDEHSASKDVRTPQPKQKSTTGSQRPFAVGKPSLGNASIKPQLSGFLPCQTPTRPSPMGLPATPASRLPRKMQAPFRNLTGVPHIELSEVSGGATCKPTPLKTTLFKTRLGTTPAKSSGKSLATPCKTAASTSKGASNLAVSPLTRTASARFARLTSSGPVDKNKPKAGSRQQQASQPNQNKGPPDVVPVSVSGTGEKDPSIQQLRGHLTASNCRFEAVAIVLQKTLAERDEATRQCRTLSEELVNLRGELGCSVQSSERLEREKDELRVVLEDALHKLQEQHQKDLSELEQRLQAFYQDEWDKVQLTYQEDADKCKTMMQHQIEEVKANHEAMKVKLEDRHTEQLQRVKQQYEVSLEELCKVHKQELQSWAQTLKDTESTLSGQIEALTVENAALLEKLTAEENMRKKQAENSQKDYHMLYLEQELESLKVVLDIKNKQLHQQEKKLMDIDKLKDKNMKLDESLQKVQQENEDLKARMDRHAAMSRQLSTEQAVLQESLQKESKVNKRLSMENEELTWKLQNGDLSSPRRVSPTSTSTSLSDPISFQSPRSSGLFSSPPMSPR